MDSLTDNDLTWRQRARRQDSRWRINLTLRIVSTILIIPAITMIAQCAVIYSKGPGFLYHDSNGDADSAPLFDLISLIPLVWALLWNCIHYILLCTARKTLHPGAIVTTELLTWLAFVATNTLASLTTNAFSYQQPANDPSGSGSLIMVPKSYASVQARPYELAHVSMGWVMLAIHFTIFVIACRTADIRRREGPSSSLTVTKSQVDAAMTHQATLHKNVITQKDAEIAALHHALEQATTRCMDCHERFFEPKEMIVPGEKDRYGEIDGIEMKGRNSRRVELPAGDVEELVGRGTTRGERRLTGSASSARNGSGSERGSARSSRGSRALRSVRSESESGTLIGEGSLSPTGGKRVSS
ncbi:MAG: hypothetical protein M1817_005554 [Caeruleum heppii]|nr:MAG: hypothetical protein M1817_005554 [Caeruleum heppii]